MYFLNLGVEGLVGPRYVELSKYREKIRYSEIRGWR